MLGAFERLLSGDRKMMTQTLYKGRYPDQRPTQEQLELLRRMGVKEAIIQSLTRAEAYMLIRTIWTRYYQIKFEKQRKPFEVYIKW